MGQVYEKAKLFSEDNLRRLRAAVKPHIPADAIVATFGSYARREASALSDIDYIIISNDPESLSKPSEEVEEAIKSIVDIEPSPDGAFGKVIQRSDILKNLGGEQDSNQSLTLRLLLLLEGEWLAGEAHFNELRRQLIERYWPDPIGWSGFNLSSCSALGLLPGQMTVLLRLLAQAR